MRLDKYLADCQIGTRSEVKKLIKAGQIAINGQTVKSPDTKLDETKDAITYKGTPVVYEKFGYYLLYKPAGCVTARTDNLHKTVMEYLPALPDDYSPVGRLDLDTEGVLLITNDGALNHRLMSPASHVDKTYYAKLNIAVSDNAIEAFEKGVDIGDDKPTKPARLELLEDRKGALLTISEGRYHQVKRMFATQGATVTYLRRESLAGLTLEGLTPGEYRKLTKEEIDKL